MSLALGRPRAHRGSDSQGQAVPLLNTPLLTLLQGAPLTPGTLSSAWSLIQPDWPSSWKPRVCVACPPLMLPSLPETSVLPCLSLPTDPAVLCCPGSSLPSAGSQWGLPPGTRLLPTTPPSSRPAQASPCPLPTPGRAPLTPVGHDGDAGPSPLQGPQPLLVILIILLSGIEAGGEELQAHVAVLLQEPSHLLGTLSAGAPGEKAGDPIVKLRVQVPGLDLLQQVALRVAGGLRSLGRLSTEEAGRVSVIGGERGRGWDQGQAGKSWPQAQNTGGALLSVELIGMSVRYSQDPGSAPLADKHRRANS